MSNTAFYILLSKNFCKGNKESSKIVSYSAAWVNDSGSVISKLKFQVFWRVSFLPDVGSVSIEFNYSHKCLYKRLTTSCMVGKEIK